MATVLGAFETSELALEAVETMRGAQLNTDNVRVVSGPDNVTDVAAKAAGAARLAAGPADAVVDGLVASDLSPSELQSVRQRVNEGAALVLGEDLDQDDANLLTQHLREHRAENVINHEAPDPAGAPH